MELTEIPAADFDLAKTLDSGQVFHWEKVDNGFVGTIGDLPIYVEHRGGILKVRTHESHLDRLKRSSWREERMLSKTVAHYFALDHPLAEICASFPNDPVMKAADDFCGGLRIIRQPKWECLATFICSSMKQVAHIRQISKKLRERFGDARKIDLPSPRLRRGEAGEKIDNLIVYAFPSAERIAASSEENLRGCALGYRAKNLLKATRLVGSGEADLEAWSALSDVDLRARLCDLPGVGVKVANCVMLFAYERLRAFPIDVWIERVLKEKYFPRARKLNASRLEAFTQEYFGDHGGYAQQYLFHHARKTAGRTRTAKQPRNLSPRRA